MNSPTVTPTADQINQTKQAIESYIRSIDSHPDRRDGAYPYYLIHEPAQPIRGTVMIFHGFSAKPHQMWRLATYLFENGFNVYQASLAGHSLLRPAKNWPQIDLKPEIANPLKDKIQKDPVLMTYLANISANPGGSSARPGYMQRVALIARLLKIEPRLLDIVKAIESPNDPDFDKYFISSHRDYLTHATARLAELVAMPGPVYTVGLSVGGAVALALAANHPERVKRVVTYAPLLRILGDDRRQYVNLAGPLDIKESGWDPNLQFPVGCLTANDHFGGSEVMSAKSIKSLQQIPTFMVLTTNEDAADIETNKTFFRKIGDRQNGHRFYQYPVEALVPHPMVDPTEVSQNMSNRFWQSLYQETFRFLSTGETDDRNMSNLEQVPDLPQVAPVS
ncbi:MAG: alpha/beta fold hydrolase [Scytolyngbya sp. HA4215-MV1]|jgi:pimeloyl-ACP methyl ester carboxylesterase|nr:alpha/beta fold hydrolase [Scytolyngbya sp. HA4215-MV1]